MRVPTAHLCGCLDAPIQVEPPRDTMPTVTRPLAARERDILDLLLGIDFPGVVELRAQAAAVAANTDGLIVGLVVPEGVPAADVVARIPVQAVVDGDGYDGGLLLFVDDGRLSALEYWWVTEDKPDQMPPLTAIGNPITA